MIKLLRSNLKRIIASKTFWICSAVYILYGLIWSIVLFAIGENVGVDIRSSEYPFANYGLSGSPFTGIIIMIFLCVIMSADFTNNAIRNKILMGYSKGQIYISNLLAFSVCAIVLNLIYLLITLAFFFGSTASSSVLWHWLDKSELIQTLLWTIFYNILNVLLYVSFYTMITMIVKNAVATITTGTALSVLAIFISWIVLVNDIEPLEFLYFYPTGIDAMIANSLLIISSMISRTYFIGPISIVIIYIILTTTIGLLVFKKSNIK